MAEILQKKMELENELEQTKIQDEQKSKEWEAAFEARLKSVQNDYQKEIENRRVQEESQIETLKRINEEDEQKLKALTKTLGELQTVVAAKTQEMKDIKIVTHEPKPNFCQQSIKIAENKLIGSSDIGELF
uniref:Uncharacterized protein n=1 Tax=Panagrolaimus superbus TaxID=310955 RepID=A0A914YGL1_9BILA